MALIVKICGVTSVEDARLAVAAGASAVGLNFHPPSPRFLSIERARTIAEALPAGVWRVGVFVDRSREEILRIAQEVNLDTVQFHGDEPEELCRGWHLRTIRAVRLRRPEDAARLAGVPADYVLVDAYLEDRPGGTGRRVPLDWLAGAPRERLIVAGGLTPANVGEVVRCLRPAGVDVASGVESEPGRKDPGKVKEFIENARAA